MQQIPNADLKEFLSGNSKTKAAFAKKIGRSFQEIGFFSFKRPLFRRQTTR
jgi:isopenicillin N synthase-like dioxygenase